MDRDAPKTIAAAVALSCIGVFGLLPQPIFLGALQDVLGFSSQQASLITASEVIGGAVASILAAFWIQKVNWRTAGLFAIAVVVAGNIASSFVASSVPTASISSCVRYGSSFTRPFCPAV